MFARFVCALFGFCARKIPTISKKRRDIFLLTAPGTSLPTILAETFQKNICLKLQNHFFILIYPWFLFIETILQRDLPLVFYLLLSFNTATLIEFCCSIMFSHRKTVRRLPFWPYLTLGSTKALLVILLNIQQIYDYKMPMDYPLVSICSPWINTITPSDFPSYLTNI